MTLINLPYALMAQTSNSPTAPTVATNFFDWPPVFAGHPPYPCSLSLDSTSAALT